MKNFLNWLIYSSENPEQFSLTIKGLLVTNAVIILALIKQFFGVEIPMESYVEIVGVGVASLGMILVGLGMMRKLYYLVLPYFKKK